MASIFLMKTPSGLVVARTDPTKLVDGHEHTYSNIAEIKIRHEGRLSADNPDLQDLLRQVFVAGATFAKNFPKVYISRE